jgi:hypothetical protein
MGASRKAKSKIVVGHASSRRHRLSQPLDVRKTMENIALMIAGISLVMSGVSLFFSLKKDKHEKRFVTAQKKSDLLRHILDSKNKLEKRLFKMQKMNKIWGDCGACPTDSLESIELKVTNLIQRYTDLFSEISLIKNNTDPVLLENLIPHLYDMSQDVDDGFLDTIDLIEGCLACQKKYEQKTI